MMSQCHADSVFAWRRAAGERETFWCKRGVSLLSGKIGGVMCFECVADRAAKLRSRCRSTTGICAALVGTAFARRPATGQRETCCGVSLASGMSCGIV